MPTALPTRTAPQTYRRGRTLTWSQTVRFFWLFARVMILDVRLQRAHQRVRRTGLDADGAELLRLAHRWLATHEAIAVLLQSEEPAAITEMRATLRLPEPLLGPDCAVPAALPVPADKS
jgi:hypothetical protein